MEILDDTYVYTPTFIYACKGYPDLASNFFLMDLGPGRLPGYPRVNTLPNAPLASLNMPYSIRFAYATHDTAKQYESIQTDNQRHRTITPHLGAYGCTHLELLTHLFAMCYEAFHIYLNGNAISPRYPD